MLFSFQDKSRSVLVSDDASATTLLLILIRDDDDDDDEFKFVRGMFARFFAATTTTREQQKRGVVLIIDFSDEEETEEEEIMLLFMMMMPCALYRYIHRERKSAKLFFPLERSKSRSRALMNGERCATLSFLLVCLSESELKGKTLCLLSFSCALVFSERFLREVGVLDTTGSKKSFRERERKSAKERAHRKKDRQTQKDGERRRKKTESRILGREDDIVRDDDDLI